MRGAEVAEGPPSGPLGTPAWQRFGLALGPLLFLVCLFLPGLPLDLAQRKAAGVTLWTAAWWITEALPVGAASLVPAVLFPLTGVLPAQEVAPLYMSDLVLLFLGAFVVALGLERWGVHRRIALAVLAKAGPEPRFQVLAFMAAAAGLSLWINNTSTTLLMLPIALAVLERMGSHGEAERSRFGLALLLGIAWSASVGGMGSPVGTAPNQVYLGQMATLFPGSPDVGFAQWMLAFGPLVVLWVPIAWWLLTRVLFPTPRLVDGTEARASILRDRAELGRMSVPERRMALVFVITAVLWVTRADVTLGGWTLPGWWRLVAHLQGIEGAALAGHERDITDATVAVAMGLVCFLTPARGTSGPKLMDWDTARRLPWEVLLLLGAGFALAKGFRASGLDGALGSALGPVLEGQSPWLVVGAFALCVSFLTEVTSNTATTAVLLPVVGEAASAAGLDPRLVMVPTTLAASAAFMLPVATPPNAVVFASGHVPAPVMARAGVILNLVTVVLLTVLFQLWVRPLWGIGQLAPEWARP